MFFHLLRLLLVSPETETGQATGDTETSGAAGVTDVAIALEQFLQTSTIGEFERRLEMVCS
jgi:hypothetical protein